MVKRWRRHNVVHSQVRMDYASTWRPRKQCNLFLIFIEGEVAWIACVSAGNSLVGLSSHEALLVCLLQCLLPRNCKSTNAESKRNGMSCCLMLLVVVRVVGVVGCCIVQWNGKPTCLLVDCWCCSFVDWLLLPFVVVVGCWSHCHCCTNCNNICTQHCLLSLSIIIL